MWRWIRIGVGSIVFIVVLAALVGFRQDLFEFSINPRSPFQVMTPPPPPDYSNYYNWASWPGTATEDQQITDQAPDDLRSDDARSGDNAADIFYIHTTTYLRSKAWNGYTQGKERERVETYLIPGQAVIFAELGNLYAPLYRQATLYSFYTRNLDSTRARMLAYSDIDRAFKVFLSERDPNKPFFIVGHGQGAVHALRLLTNYVAPTDIKSYMVAAYLTGATVPLNMFQNELAPLEPCRSKDQIGCVAAWTVFEDGNSSSEFFEHALYWKGDELLPAENEEILCVNPLTWSMDERVASATLNLGAIPIVRNKKKPLGGLLSQAAGAQCRNGILFTDRPQARSLRRSIFIGDRPNHLIDLNLFFQNVRANAGHRLTIFLDQHGRKKRNGKLY